MNEIIKRLSKCQVVAGFSVDNVEDAVPIAQALLAGGIDCIELTLRTPNALLAIAAISTSVPEICLGVGTVLTPEQVVQVKEHGAHFAVAPGLNRKVIQAAQAVNLPFAPGIMTPTELEAAIEEGCTVVKFFPAQASGGVNLLKSMSSPYKHLGIQYFPLGGINSENMHAYLALENVPAVGGSFVVQKDLVKAKDWQGIQANAARVCQSLKEQ